MEDKRRDQIIDDLLLKRPTANGCTYEDESYFDYGQRRDRVRPVPSHDGYGYSDQALFNLGLHERYLVERYVRTRFYSGKWDGDLRRGQRGGVTRKTNRIWERIMCPIRRIARAGDCGIYNVMTSSYGESICHIHAVDKPTAERVAEVMFGYLIADPARMHVEFVEVTTDPTAVISRNEKVVADINKSISKDEADLVELQDDIRRKKARLDAVLIIREQALEVAAK